MMAMVWYPRYELLVGPVYALAVTEVLETLSNRNPSGVRTHLAWRMRDQLATGAADSLDKYNFCLVSEG